MWTLFLTFALWLAVGASAVAWIMPGMMPRADQTSGRLLPGGVAHAVPAADWSPLLTSGAPAAPAAAAVASDASRFRLVGVAAPVRPSGHGVAILSLDGQPPRAFKTGDPVDDARVVLEVSAHTVKIGPRGGAPSLVLQAPLLPPAATGVPPGLAAPPT